MKSAEGSRGVVTNPIEAPDHEMRELAVAEKMRLGHLDPCLPRHARVRVLDPSPRPRSAGATHPQSGAVRRHPVELDQPRLLSRIGGREARPHAVRRPVPKNQRLRPRPSGNAADLHDLGHCNRHIPFDNPAGLVDQLPDFQRLPGSGRRVQGRVELKGAHGTFADVKEPLQG